MEIKEIKNIVCDYFGIKESDLIRKTKKRNIVFPRQVAIYLSKTHTNESINEIGYWIGKKSHSTVLHSFRLISDLKQNYKSVNKVIGELNGKIETLKNGR